MFLAPFAGSPIGKCQLFLTPFADSPIVECQLFLTPIADRNFSDNVNCSWYQLLTGLLVSVKCFLHHLLTGILMTMSAAPDSPVSECQLFLTPIADRNISDSVKFSCHQLLTRLLVILSTHSYATCWQDYWCICQPFLTQILILCANFYFIFIITILSFNCNVSVQ